MLGHKVSNSGLEVDKAKVEVFDKLSPPIFVKGVCNFNFLVIQVSIDDSSRIFPR